MHKLVVTGSVQPGIRWNEVKRGWGLRSVVGRLYVREHSIEAIL